MATPRLAALIRYIDEHEYHVDVSDRAVEGFTEEERRDFIAWAIPRLDTKLFRAAEIAQLLFVLKADEAIPTIEDCLSRCLREMQDPSSAFAESRGYEAVSLAAILYRFGYTNRGIAGLITVFEKAKKAELKALAITRMQCVGPEHLDDIFGTLMKALHELGGSSAMLVLDHFFNFRTLFAGVLNQRGNSLTEESRPEFIRLIEQAIQFRLASPLAERRG